MRSTNIAPLSPPRATPLHVPANAFANDGNFMAQFLSAHPRASSSEADGGGDSSSKDAVVAAEQDDHVRQSVEKNDGSFMATFLALQHKEERRQQQREKEQQARANKDPDAAPKTVSGSSDDTKQTQQQKTKVAANAVAIEQPSSKNKRSRWDAGPAIPLARAAKSARHTDDGGGNEEAGTAALLVDDSDDLDAAREASIRAKQQKHSQELRFLEQRLRGFHQQSQLSKSAQSSKEHKLAMLSDERRQEYERLAQLLEAEKTYKDSLEDAELGTIQDGTLEHRRRAREMLETLQTADALTTHAEGKHHLGDFLPQTELDKFMKEAQALTSRTKLGLEGSNAQLTDQQQSGSSSAAVLSANWTAAAASGSDSAASRGLGHEPTGQLQEDDDEFDQYRKRMMLAYRFRPNPLNNPRRPYT